MEAVAAGLEQQQAFGELVDAHRGIVLKVANTYCRNRHDQEDLAQEIVLQLWRAFPSWDPARPFSTWMYRIALNVSISQLRYRTRRPTLPLDEPHHEIEGDMGPDVEQDNRVHALYAFIDKLDPMNRALLLLYLEDKSYRAIAEILGISETNVSTRINRLKGRMKNDLGQLAD